MAGPSIMQDEVAGQEWREQTAQLRIEVKPWPTGDVALDLELKVSKRSERRHLSILTSLPVSLNDTCKSPRGVFAIQTR